MSTRRRIGVSTATTEAARRQLMQPVACWEKVWETVESAPTVKVPRWVKTEKIQQFSDDEGEVDEPLAPLPDEPEIIEGDEEMDDENGAIAGPEEAINALKDSESQELLSKPPSPKPQLIMSLQPPSELPVEVEQTALDITLNPFDGTMDGVVDVEGKISAEDIMGLDMTGLGTDGTEFGSLDEILGGPLLDETGVGFETEA